MMGHRPHICAIALTALRWSSDRREEAAIANPFSH
jgi:hypothetical protein